MSNKQHTAHTASTAITRFPISVDFIYLFSHVLLILSTPSDSFKPNKVELLFVRHTPIGSPLFLALGFMILSRLGVSVCSAPCSQFLHSLKIRVKKSSDVC